MSLLDWEWAFMVDGINGMKPVVELESLQGFW